MQRTLATNDTARHDPPTLAAVGTHPALQAGVQVQPAPAEVADTASALGCFYNGQQPAIVRAGVVRFPAFALFTIEHAGTPAHGATFSVQSDTLNPDTLATCFYETIRRFAA